MTSFVILDEEKNYKSLQSFKFFVSVLQCLLLTYLVENDYVPHAILTNTGQRSSVLNCVPSYVCHMSLFKNETYRYEAKFPKKPQVQYILDKFNQIVQYTFRYIVNSTTNPNY